MKIILHSGNRLDGRINLRQTVDTMEAGESLTLTDQQIDADYARTVCSRYGRKVKRVFTVSYDSSDAGAITIKRLS